MSDGVSLRGLRLRLDRRHRRNSVPTRECLHAGRVAAERRSEKRSVENIGPTENFIRDAAVTYHHQTCTAKMGRDAMLVVDGSLRVYGIENLRIADGSIMPRVTTGNTMAGCVIIGERAGELLRSARKLSGAEGISIKRHSHSRRFHHAVGHSWHTMTPCVVIGGRREEMFEKRQYNYD